MPGTDNGFQVSPDNLDQGATSLNNSANDWQAIRQALMTNPVYPSPVLNRYTYFNDVSIMFGTHKEYLKTWNFHEAVSEGVYLAINDLALNLSQAAYDYRIADSEAVAKIAAAKMHTDLDSPDS